MTMKTGSVLFVGAGPGDPKLLTIKGMEALQHADVVVYDRLANPLLLAHVKQEARLVYCGKEADRHTLPQDEINRLLVREAQRGQIVVRLKGGDPSMFGRVGEEAQECLAHGIPFEIVPGITSGMAAPLYAGIPLTHREYNSSVAFVTGHFCEKNAGKELDWAALARMETLVIYMGVKNLPRIKDSLLAHGKHPDTPVALVRWGTLGEQQTVEGRLLTIDQTAAQAGFRSPAIIVVGEVVRLRESLNWHESKPMFGQTIAVASRRTGEQSLAQALERLGAEVWPLPLSEMPRWQTDSGSGFPEAVEDYPWIVFDSERHVTAFFRELSVRRFDIRRLRGKMVARGLQAARALEERGLYPHRVLEEPGRSVPIRQLLPEGQGERILHVRGGKSPTVRNGEEAVDHLWLTGELGWDREHLASRWFTERSFDWLAADEPDALSVLAELAEKGWKDGKLLCVGEETVRFAKELGASGIVACPAGIGQLEEVLDQLATASKVTHLYS